MKTEKPQNINFGYRLENDNYYIAPMLIIPFIENAFKHSKIDRYQNHKVDITIEQSSNKALFVISNNFIETQASSNNPKPYKGIGIKNVVNRLNLLYPNAHSLTISKEKNQYKVELTIKLNGSK